MNIIRDVEMTLYPPLTKTTLKIFLKYISFSVIVLKKITILIVKIVNN